MTLFNGIRKIKLQEFFKLKFKITCISLSKVIEIALVYQHLLIKAADKGHQLEHCYSYYLFALLSFYITKLKLDIIFNYLYFKS